MDALPSEVLHLICSQLDFEDAANIRFLTRDFSVVAAEYLVSQVRFHTSCSSLERLENISSHPIFSRTVKSLTYEAALLADVKCRHEYARHFELDHHGIERPREPPSTCSSRERRLHMRNRSKWTQDIYSKYDIYRSLFDSQYALLTQNVLEDALARYIPRFTKLTHIDLDPIRRCPHRTSARFIEEFGSDCASPLSANYSRTGSLLKYILLPPNYTITSLRSLEVNSLTPTFFNQNSKDVLSRAFQNLTCVDIILKLADGDIESGETPPQSFDRHLSDGTLRDVLRSANNLQTLSIGIDLAPPFSVDVSQILSDSVWTELKSISLSTVKSTQQDLMATLKRQPKLRNVNLALMQLTQGSWPDVVDQVRAELALEEFEPIGFLEDSEESWPMDLLCVPVYMDTFIELELSRAINVYVTKRRHEQGIPNPLGEGFSEFEEGDVVRDMYGTPSDIDSMSLDDSEISMSAFSDSDISMDDLDVDATGITDV